jgi:hypothetical protein
MVGIPVAIPVAVPVDDTEPSVLLLLLHVPPVGEEPSDVLLPGHTDAVPVIADGIVLTVNTVVVKQPVGSV